MDRSEGGNRTRGGNAGHRSNGDGGMDPKARKAAAKASEEQLKQLNKAKEAMKKKLTVGEIAPFIQDVSNAINDMTHRQEVHLLAMKYMDPDFASKFNEAERRIRQLQEKIQEIKHSNKGLDWLRQQTLLWNADERNKPLSAGMFGFEWIAEAFSPSNPGAQTLPLEERVLFAQEFGMTEQFVDTIVKAPVESPATIEATPLAEVIQFPSNVPMTSEEQDEILAKVQQAIDEQEPS